MPDTITAEHVRELLRSPARDPRLVVVGGRAHVVPAGDLGAGRFRGAVEVLSRDDLAARLGTAEPSERDAEALAARLNTAVAGTGA